MASTASHRNWHPVEGIISDLDGVVYRGSAAIADAIEKWAEGSPKCHGIGGNP